MTRAAARCGPETKQVRKVNRKLSDKMEVDCLVLTRHRTGTHVCQLGSANYMHTELRSKVRRTV